VPCTNKYKYALYLPKTRAYLHEWYKQGCLVCGVYAPSIIEAHHVDPVGKEFEVGHVKTMDELMDELSKCVPLCKNHHSLMHLAMRNGGAGMGWDALVEYVKTKHPQTM
jgi:predicted restriction endonuclease